MEKSSDFKRKCEEKKHDLGTVVEVDYINEINKIQLMLMGKRKFAPIDKFLERYEKREENFSKKDIDKSRDLLDNLDSRVERINLILTALSRQKSDPLERRLLSETREIFSVIFKNRAEEKFLNFVNFIEKFKEETRKAEG